nr:zinc finger, CCHC-type, retrotransposon Gag domain protein [Tanacetum cinerariifolium]
IREEFRTGSGPSNAGGNSTPVTIYTWLERFNKQKPNSFEKATVPVDAENWISHMEKIFDVIGCEDTVKTRLAVYKFEAQGSISEDEDAMDKGVADRLKKINLDDADRDEGPPTGPNQGLKMKKTGKYIEPSKKSKTTRTSKGTTKSKAKYTSKSAQAEEIVFEAGDSQVPQDLREGMGNTDEPPDVKVDQKNWFKKLERPPTLDPKWNECKTVDSKPTHKWLSNLNKEEKSSKTFDDLMSTPINFIAFAMNRLQISDLTEDILVGSAYTLLKGTCRSYVELEYKIEECYKALNDQLDWNNPKGDRYPFDLRKSLPLVQSRNHHIVPVDHFFNNDLTYFQGGSTGKTYTTSLTKTKATKVSKHDVYSTKRILAVINVKVYVWYGYGHLEEIEIQRSDQEWYKFMEGDFSRLHLNNVEEMLLLVV